MNPDSFAKDYQKDLALGFRKQYKQVLGEIKTFEGIFKDKTRSADIRAKTKMILKDLYKERDLHAGKAEHYRKIYLTAKGTKRSLGWGKGRT